MVIRDCDSIYREACDVVIRDCDSIYREACDVVIRDCDDSIYLIFSYLFHI